MGDNTKIEWTHAPGMKGATWNPIVGCTRVSEGCRNCYAERLAATRLKEHPRYAGLAKMTPSGPRWTGQVRLVPEVLDQPLRWTRPRMIFVNSMSDLFHEDLPDEVIDRIFAVMALCPEHTFQVLTKRPERMREYMTTEGRLDEITMHMSDEFGWLSPDDAANIAPYGLGIGIILPKWPKWPLPNVWMGVSVENQEAADNRIPLLLDTPAALRFVSCEPLLGPIWLRPFDDFSDHGHGRRWLGGPAGNAAHSPGIDWVIVGGESGPGARPMHPDWVRSIRDQCIQTGVPFFFKQWGEWAPFRDAKDAKQHAGWGIREDLCVLWPDGTMGSSIIGDPYKSWARGCRGFRRVGKQRAGGLLDGREWRELPEVARR